MLTFPCPSCQSMLDAREESAGTKIFCPYCQHSATVPANNKVAPPPDVVPSVPTTAIQTEPTYPSVKANPDAPREGDARTEPADNLAKDSLGGSHPANLDVSRPPRRTGKRLLLAGVIIVAVGALAGTVALVVRLVIPSVQRAREDEARRQEATRQAEARKKTAGNMRKIGLGFYDYAAKEKPPASLSPKMSQPQLGANTTGLSWRVALLPHLGHDALFEQVDVGKDWNHPRNQPLWDKRPPQYDCPWQPPSNATLTPFQVFTGPRTLFPDAKAEVRLEDIPDGTAHTILFAQAAAPVVWTKAQDMVIPPSPPWPNSPQPLPLPSGRFLAVMADATVRMIDRGKINDNILRQLIDPRDGAKPALDWDDLER
jgi:Protein of unknown function (DUF1559)